MVIDVVADLPRPPDARRVADWIAANDDSNGKSFVLIDKQSDSLYVFDGRTRLFTTSPVLLGSAGRE